MRICLMIEGQENVTWEQWRGLARTAEAAGLDGLFRADHYRSIHRGDPAGSLDAWLTLAALAAETKRIRLGSLVSPVTFRHAAVLAKSVVTVDHISNGRVELGLGTGWFAPEHEAYGIPFPSFGARLDELERQLAEIRRQWSEADDIWPKPIQHPGPPVIVGGRGLPRTVRSAIRFADEYNTVAPTLEQAKERVHIVNDAARKAGREPLRFSVMIGCVLGRDEAEARDRLRAWQASTTLVHVPQFVGTVEQVAEKLRAYEAVGVGRAMLQHLAHEDLAMVELLGDLARELTPGVGA